MLAGRVHSGGTPRVGPRARTLGRVDDIGQSDRARIGRGGLAEGVRTHGPPPFRRPSGGLWRRPCGTVAHALPATIELGVRGMLLPPSGSPVRGRFSCARIAVTHVVTAFLVSSLDVRFDVSTPGGGKGVDRPWCTGGKLSIATSDRPSARTLVFGVGRVGCCSGRAVWPEKRGLAASVSDLDHAVFVAPLVGSGEGSGMAM